MKKIALCFAALTLFTSIGSAGVVSQERLEQLARDPQWLKLLHFHTDIFGRRRSSIDDPGFFLSPRGRVDPRAELEATIREFQNGSPPGGEPAACRYPARFAWAVEELGEVFPIPACPRFDAWREKLNPTSVQMVFASYYLNNPASMYGHTFLKLNRGGYEENKGLLDYTVNFTAETNTNNGLMFALKGLLGGYRGKFSTEPYYFKIQKYNNMESRDLWEYDLHLTTAAIDRLVRHLWELGQTSMAYFFFNKNCSYQLLPLLEAADPDADFSSGLRFRAIPLDTLRTLLDRPGFVTGYRIRPSHIRVLLHRRSFLSEDEIILAEELVQGTESVDRLSSLPSPRQALVLDSAYDFLRYKHGFYRNQPPDVRERERRLLLLRQALPPETQKTFSIPEDAWADLPPPQRGHKTARVSAGFGSTKTEPFEEISVRAAIHDLESNPVGYVEGSQLEMFNVRVRYENQRGRAYLERFTLIDILSLTPRDRWVHPPTWGVRASLATAHDVDKDPEDALHAAVDGGSGITIQPGIFPAVRLYAMWRGEAGAGSVFRDGYRIGAGGRAGVLWRQSGRLRFHAFASALRFGIGHPGNRVAFQATQTVDIATDAEIRLGFGRQNAHQEGTLHLNYYW